MLSDSILIFKTSTLLGHNLHKITCTNFKCMVWWGFVSICTYVTTTGIKAEHCYYTGEFFQVPLQSVPSNSCSGWILIWSYHFWLALHVLEFHITEIIQYILSVSGFFCSAQLKNFFHVVKCNSCPFFVLLNIYFIVWMYTVCTQFILSPMLDIWGVQLFF